MIDKGRSRDDDGIRNAEQSVAWRKALWQYAAGLLQVSRLLSAKILIENILNKFTWHHSAFTHFFLGNIMH